MCIPKCKNGNGKPDVQFPVKCDNIKPHPWLPQHVMLIMCETPIPTEWGPVHDGTWIVPKSDISNYVTGRLEEPKEVEISEPKEELTLMDKLEIEEHGTLMTDDERERLEWTEPDPRNEMLDAQVAAGDDIDLNDEDIFTW